MAVIGLFAYLQMDPNMLQRRQSNQQLSAVAKPPSIEHLERRRMFSAPSLAQGSTHLPTGDTALSAAALGGKAYFAGGPNIAPVFRDEVRVFDPHSGSFSTAHLSLARYEIAITTVGTKVIFACGLASARDGSDVASGR